MDAGFDSGYRDAWVEREPDREDGGADGGPDAGPDAGADAGCDDTWFDLGDSAWTPHCVRTGGSAFGGGVSGMHLRSDEHEVAVSPTGQILVGWQEAFSPYDDWDVNARLWNGGAWVGLGGSATPEGISADDGRAQEPSVDLADDGRAVAAWSDDTSGQTQIYVRVFDGVAWVELGGSATGGGLSATTADSVSPSARLDAGGNPVVAWREGTSVHLKRWDGGGWVELDGSATGDGVSASSVASVGPELELDSAGRPVVAWAAGGIALRRWDGSAWVGMESGSASSSPGSGARTISLALGPDDAPALAWEVTVAGNREVYATQWDGSTWAELDGSLTAGGVSDTPEGLSASPSVAVDPAGRVLVAWSEDGTGGWNPEIYLERFDGSTWEELGGSATGGGVSGIGGGVTGTPAWSYEPEVVVGDDGSPIVAWQEWTPGNAEIYLRRWDGAGWRSLGETARGEATVSRTDSRSSAPTVVLDDAQRPVLAWWDVDGDHVIRATRYDGTGWTAEAYPAIDTGVPTNFGWEQYPPALVLDGAGDPIVAWADNESATHVDRWNGVAWERLGGGPVGTGDWQVSLAVDSVGPIVAYSPYVDPRREIHVMRWESGAWSPLDGVGGDIAGTDAWSQQPRLAVTSDDRVVVAWQEGDLNGGEIALKVWDGDAWTDLGGSGAGGITDGSASAGPPALALGPDDEPIVAWFHRAAARAYELRLLRWDGDAFGPVGGDPVVVDGFGAILTGARAPALAVDADGHPVVAWTDERTGQYEIYLRRWDGSEWVDDAGVASGGGVSNSTAASIHPWLASRAGRTCLAWDEFGRVAKDIVLRCAEW